MRILVVFGTRPEAIKMAPVIRQLQAQTQIEVKVCVTAQHRQMLDQVLALFKIVPDYDLDLMRKEQDLTDVTSRVLMGMRDVLREFQPERLLVHGDTTTTLAASLAAYYEHVSVGHVEAGLRTGNIYAPWPEEVNRKLVSSIADLHFVPTLSARQNLLREDIPEDNIVVTGNTVIDALQWGINILDTSLERRRKIDAQFDFIDDDRKLILVTGHRRENFGSGLEQICQAICRLAQRDDIQIVYPVHLNPHVQKTVTRMLGNEKSVHLIEPVDYLPFIYLMRKAHLILTDSGGIQEEAPSVGKPVLVMRNVTERPEAVMEGAVKLVGSDDEVIFNEVSWLLDNPGSYEAMRCAHNPYGDGQAAGRIVSACLQASRMKSGVLDKE